MLNLICNNHLYNTDDGGQVMGEDLRYVQARHALHML